MEKEYLEFIKSRKSIREFISEKIPNNILNEIIECGRWAPSGLNNQPWKVIAVAHPTVKRMIAELTKDHDIIDSAFCCFVVFYDIEKGYDRVKDILAIGAFMENILLAIHAYPNLGAVWMGEILNQKEKVNEIFKSDPQKLELMGVISLGVVEERVKKEEKKPRERRPINDIIEYF
jgi:nitroreductase